MTQLEEGLLAERAALRLRVVELEADLVDVRQDYSDYKTAYAAACERIVKLEAELAAANQESRKLETGGRLETHRSGCPCARCAGEREPC